MRYLIVVYLLVVSALSAKPIAPPEFNTPQQRLFFFVCDGNLEGIDASLAEGANINAVEKDSYPLLHISIFQENQEVFDQLLERGADIHLFSDFGNCNALSLATIYDRREMILKLLDAGADPNAAEVESYMKEYSAIAYAALYGHVDLLKLFAARGGDLEKPVRWPMWQGIPPEFPLLSVAAQHGGVEVVRYLVEERGHAVNPTGKIPVLPPLSVAVRYNNMKVAKYLISKGADVNAVGHDYYDKGHRSKYRSNWLSPLGVAARYNRPEMVKLLFAQGSKIRKDVQEFNHPMYLADWAGYYRVIEEFEKQGHTFDYWSVIERQFRSGRSQKEEVPAAESSSEYTPTLLRGHRRQWELSEAAELSKPLRLAVIADDKSAEVADLLTVALSGKSHLELVERSAMEKVLSEQKLNRAALTTGEHLSLVSDLLDAQALILIERLTIDKKPIFQLRLVNSIFGLQFGRHFIENEAAALNDSLESYADTVGVLANTFRRKYEQAIPISLVNVRSDLGTLEAVKVENTLKQLLELELLSQPAVILTQREDLENLTLEKDLGGREEEFKASSLFVDVGVEFDTAGEKPINYTVRIQPASGHAYTLELAAQPNALNETAADICRAILARVEADYTEADFGQQGTLNKDAETYFKEARWNFNLEQYAACLEGIRTSISLGYNKRDIWDYYYRAIESLIDDRREHRGNDVNNRNVLALERERLVALEGILRLHRSDVTEKALRAPKFGNDGRGWLETEGIVETFARFRPVSMQRRYAKELQSLERQFLRLINNYLAPCYAEPMAHGKFPYLQTRDIFQVVDLMAQLDESEYATALEGLMVAFLQRDSKGSNGRPISPSFYWAHPPVAVPRWEIAANKFLKNAATFSQSLGRLQISYLGRFESNWSPEVLTSILDRQELSARMLQAAHSPTGDGDAAIANALRRKLVFAGILSLDGSDRWFPREGVVPVNFHRFDEEYEAQRIKFAVLTDDPFGIEPDSFNHIETVTMALEAYEAALASGQHQGTRSLEEKIDALKKRRDFMVGLLETEERLGFSELPISLWSLEKNAGPEFRTGSRLLHRPIIHEGAWVVLAAANRGSESHSNNPRFALLKINPETLETKTLWINQSLKFGAKVDKAGQWLAMAVAGEPIKMIHIDTLETKDLPGYIPTKSPQNGRVYLVSRQERLFFFVQPKSLGYGDLHGRENSSMQILLRYDPETDVSEVIYNTRRNPPRTILDGTGSVFDLEGASDRFLLVSEGAHGPFYLVDAEIMDIRKTNRKEFRKIINSESSELSRVTTFGGSTTIVGVSWSGVVPRIKKEQQEKLPEDIISLVLQSRERDDKGRLKQEKRKAVLPMPQKTDPNYPMFLERLTKVDPESSSLSRRNYVYRDNHLFGERYGYIDYDTNSDDEFWGIFKISDLAEALKNSPEL